MAVLSVFFAQKGLRPLGVKKTSNFSRVRYVRLKSTLAKKLSHLDSSFLP